MYGVYAKYDDEMYLMNSEQVWEYLREDALFENYSVVTDGDTVRVVEPSMGANGLIEEISLDDFYGSFEEVGVIIRPITDR